MRSFGLRDTIPYHIQLTGPISSLKKFYSCVQYEPEPSSPRSQSTLTMSVSLCRQVRVEVKGQAVWKSSIIGSGTLTALPPSVELDPRLSHSAHEMALDWEGEIRCRDDIRVGHFDAGKIAMSVRVLIPYMINMQGANNYFRCQDFLVFSVVPKPTMGAFNSLRMIVPILLVTDTWVEH